MANDKKNVKNNKNKEPIRKPTGKKAISQRPPSAEKIAALKKRMTSNVNDVREDLATRYSKVRQSVDRISKDIMDLVAKYDLEQFGMEGDLKKNFHQSLIALVNGGELNKWLNSIILDNIKKRDGVIIGDKPHPIQNQEMVKKANMREQFNQKRSQTEPSRISPKMRGDSKKIAALKNTRRRMDEEKNLRGRGMMNKEMSLEERARNSRIGRVNRGSIQSNPNLKKNPYSNPKANRVRPPEQKLIKPKNSVKKKRKKTDKWGNPIDNQW